MLTVKEEIIYFMLLQKYITIQEYGTSTEKREYHYLYEKDGILKSINIENYIEKLY